MRRVPVYIINLERQPEKKLMFKKLNKWVPNKKFVKAFDASKEPLPPHNQEKDGRYGCFMSHVDIWQKVVNGKDEWVIVAEDDANIFKPLKHDWNSIIEAMKTEGADVGLLSWRKPSKDSKIPEQGSGDKLRLEKVDSVFWGTHLYIMNKNGAKRMLEEYDPAGPTPVDLLMAQKSETGEVPVYFIVGSKPYGANFEGFGSTTEKMEGTGTCWALWAGIAFAVVVFFIYLYIRSRRR